MNYKVLIINGPNLNMLGKREPGVYGKRTLETLIEETRKFDYSAKVKIDHFQSNHEGGLIDRIHQAQNEYHFIVINPGGLTHTSVCLRDALLSIDMPFVEAHISNIFAREQFRRDSLLSDVADAVITGGGAKTYILAIMAGIANNAARGK